MCGCDEDTYRLYVWRFVEKISYLEYEVVSMSIGRVVFLLLSMSTVTHPSLFVCQIWWENRLIDDIGNKCKVTVDGVDCLAQGTFKAFYTQKLNKSALRYELAVCIRTGDLVWIHGPFPCGDWPDLNIFRDAIKHQLLPGECVEADDGYKAEDPLVVRAPGAARYMEDQWWHKKRGKARKRHETVNQRIKQYSVLTHRFRHDLEKHSMCFRACAVLTQLSFEFGKRVPFEVNNYDESWADPSRCPLPGDVVPGDADYPSY